MERIQFVLFGFFDILYSCMVNTCVHHAAVRQADDLTTLTQPAMKAGDVILFLGSSVAHGAVRWELEGWRRVVLLQ